VVEAMKMEHRLTAPTAGTVEVSVRAGDRVALHQLLARVVPDVVPEVVPAVDPGGPRDGVPDGTPDGTPGDAQEAPGAHPPTDPRPTDQERTP
jgi:acetyl-CoA/propionyl-CoA carboxylase, biotin carboxylase, biotin carboxyl carrier protein